MNNDEHTDSKFNTSMHVLSFFFFTMAITLPYFRTDNLGLMFAAVFLLLAGLTNLSLWVCNYLGRKLNAIIEELRSANEIPPISIDEETEPQQSLEGE